MNQTYKASPAIPGYGSRIWLKKVVPYPLHQTLNSLCCWGGSDKSWDDEMSWEFGDREFHTAVQFLQKAGYTREGA